MRSRYKNRLARPVPEGRKARAPVINRPGSQIRERKEWARSRIDFTPANIWPFIGKILLRKLIKWDFNKAFVFLRFYLKYGFVQRLYSNHCI